MEKLEELERIILNLEEENGNEEMALLLAYALRDNSRFACYEIGRYYYNGIAVKENRKKGISFIAKTADYFVDARFMMAQYYWEMEEKDNAIIYFEKLLEDINKLENEKRKFIYEGLGDTYMFAPNPDYKKALEYYNRAVTLFYSGNACRRVAEIYKSGKLGAPDYEEALAYYKQAIQLKDENSAVFLAEEYIFTGDMIKERNYKAALDILSGFVDMSKNSVVPYYMGYIYCTGGYEVSTDFDKAEHYLREAYQLKPDGITASLFGYVEYINGNYTKAYQLLKKADEDGIDDQNQLLGVMLYEGTGVAVDKGRAYRYLMDAYCKNNMSMMSGIVLGDMLMSGDGCQQNYNLAYDVFQVVIQEWNEAYAHMQASWMVLFDKVSGGQDKEKALSTMQNLVRYEDMALKYLGDYYYEKKDFRLAESNYLDAWDKNITEAGVMLARLYENGGGTIRPNTTKAFQWFEKAAEAGNTTAQEEMECFKKTILGGYKRIRGI